MATNNHHLKCLFLLFLSCLWIPCTTGRDSLKPGDTLNSSSSLVSLKSRFALLFIPQNKIANESYLLGVSDRTSKFTVWYSNPDFPIAKDSDFLTLDRSGTLKIMRKGGDPLVLYSSLKPTNNAVATLLDSGNFVLKELYSNGTTKCVLWQSFDHPSFDHPMNKTAQKGSKRGRKKVWPCIPTVISSGLLLSVLCILGYLLKRKKLIYQGSKETNGENEVLALVRSDVYINDNDPNERKNESGPDFSVFSYTGVMAATNNFSLENKLGEGGFGPVYKGQLPGGQEIAVKRLARKSTQGTLEFKNELTLISKLQHLNLVKLFGCCIHGEERILIYEYMQNKSLDYFLYDSNRSKLLDWKKRFNIIEGIAQGLLYLHKYSRLRVIHRDIKAGNILLDKNMNPKISDFGMARIFKQDEQEASTNRIVGTYGYMSPEYAMEGVFSIKSDVYSFGVIMLEIVSGRKNNLNRPHCAQNLVRCALDLWHEGRALELIDTEISDSHVRHNVLRCIHISLLCIENDPIDRPTISDVLSMLTNESMPLPLPKTPAISLRMLIRMEDRE